MGCRAARYHDQPSADTNRSPGTPHRKSDARTRAFKARSTWEQAQQRRTAAEHGSRRPDRFLLTIRSSPILGAGTRTCHGSKTENRSLDHRADRGRDRLACPGAAWPAPGGSGSMNRMCWQLRGFQRRCRSDEPASAQRAFEPGHSARRTRVGGHAARENSACSRSNPFGGKGGPILIRSIGRGRGKTPNRRSRGDG